jgi:hypothetical protein
MPRLFLTFLIAAQLTILAFRAEAQKATPYAEPLRDASIADLKQLYKKLIDAENAHDLAAVKPFVWNSNAMASDRSSITWRQTELLACTSK